MPYLDRDGPRDECGVFAVYAPELEVNRLTFFALYALQHRGQEAAGISSSLDGHIMTVRDCGLVNQVFDEQKLNALDGQAAIGHVRYSTTGRDAWENAQPVQRSDLRSVALAHNGNILNAFALKQELLGQGATFQSTSDSEVIAALISRSRQPDLARAIAEAMARIKGAYSITLLCDDKVAAFRDPSGFRPLSLGQLPGGRFCVASESCAFDLIGAELVRDLLPGEIVVLDNQGAHSTLVGSELKPSFCLFEHIYFSRPDSVLEGQRVQVSRRRMGEILFRESPADADLVIPVPDSGNPAAAGYAIASGLPRDDGLVKNRYVARTFIQPGQELRKLGLRMKFNPMPDVVSDRRLVVVDDSIVRGNTTRQIVEMLRGAGAREVHLRISSPPIQNPCDYGIDMTDREEMVAHGRTEQQIADAIGADSLAYLSLEGVYEAIGGSPGAHCDACFTGNYPLEGRAQGKHELADLPVLNSLH